MSSERSACAGGVRSGRPRSREIDAAIMAAAHGLLRHGGASAVTVNAVAAHSGVSRATVYRRWRDRDALLLALVAEAARTWRDADAARSRAGLLAAAVASARRDMATLEVVELLPAMLRDRVDVGVGVGRGSSPAARHHAAISSAYRRAARTEPLRRDVDPDVVADLILGGLLLQRLRSGVAGGDGAVDELLRVVVDGLRLRPGSMRLTP